MKGKFKTGIFASVIQQLSKNIVQRELYNLKPDDEALTHGQNCFLKYGFQGAGARGEVEQGLPTVLHHALPELTSRLGGGELIAHDNELKPMLIPVLLKIMTVNNDTNVLYRHGKEVLDELKRKAMEALREWDMGSDQKYLALDEWCTANRISSGGSADLLSVTLFVYYCKKAF
ncbi:MAG: triphosphoribosyl-dephospho-CoA synthase [Marinilabiliaceae bacterium]|nr:triphosphoribosyl-dephospho-CoA synthase [Marinilabiliaceae bacterium]